MRSSRHRWCWCLAICGSRAISKTPRNCVMVTIISKTPRCTVLSATETSVCLRQRCLPFCKDAETFSSALFRTVEMSRAFESLDATSHQWISLPIVGPAASASVKPSGVLRRRSTDAQRGFVDIFGFECCCRPNGFRHALDMLSGCAMGHRCCHEDLVASVCSVRVDQGPARYHHTTLKRSPVRFSAQCR